MQRSKGVGNEQKRVISRLEERKLTHFYDVKYATGEVKEEDPHPVHSYLGYPV